MDPSKINAHHLLNNKKHIELGITTVKEYILLLLILLVSFFFFLFSFYLTAKIHPYKLNRPKSYRHSLKHDLLDHFDKNVLKEHIHIQGLLGNILMKNLSYRPFDNMENQILPHSCHHDDTDPPLWKLKLQS